MRVKELIKEKGYTQQEIADKLGIFKQSLNTSLNANNIPLPKLRDIADIIGCKVGDFFTDEMTDRENRTSKLVCPNCGKVLTVKTEIV